VQNCITANTALLMIVMVKVKDTTLHFKSLATHFISGYFTFIFTVIEGFWWKTKYSFTNVPGKNPKRLLPKTCSQVNN